MYTIYTSKTLKKEPLTIVETLNQSLWYNLFLNSNTDTLFKELVKQRYK